mmetsp:Transcript_20078/g.29451  ORF Transcript_20078/g.29451 Transcript_20078/m.29451 type:complete len:81 (-) Transcript_20078:150-392(-)
MLLGDTVGNNVLFDDSILVVGLTEGTKLRLEDDTKLGIKVDRTFWDWLSPSVLLGDMVGNDALLDDFVLFVELTEGAADA